MAEPEEHVNAFYTGRHSTCGQPLSKTTLAVADQECAVSIFANGILVEKSGNVDIAKVGKKQFLTWAVLEALAHLFHERANPNPIHNRLDRKARNEMADVFTFVVGAYTVKFGQGTVRVAVTATGDPVAYAQGSQAMELAKAWKQHIDSQA